MLFSILCGESEVHNLTLVWEVQDSVGCLELSGICFHAERKSLFIADDQGGLCEISPEGQFISSTHLGNFDLEGITYDPRSGLLYAVVEGEELILEISPENMSILRTFTIPRKHNGKTVMRRGSGGLEAITFIADPDHPEGGLFVVANQGKRSSDLNALFILELPIRGKDKDVRIIRYYFPDPGPVTGLCFDDKSRQFMAVVADKSLLVYYDLKGNPIKKVRLPSGRYEGVAKGRDGTLYVANENIGIFIIR